MFRAVAPLLLLLGACVAAPDPAPREAARDALPLVDLTDEFGQVWERTKDLPDAERVTAFKQAFAAILPGFYDHQRMGLPTSERYDAYLLKALKSFPEDRAGIEDVSRRFAGMLAPAQQSFETEFGPMTGYPPVYLVHSLGEFDGGTRSLPEGGRLLFGADMIHRLYKDQAVQPFFHHELFHLYHGRTFSECDPLWCNLWTEGLATYVASRLNPEATDHELLLTWPEPLRPAVERDRPAAICATLALLDSTDADDYKALFSSGTPANGLPSRYGYYVGYLTAAQAGKAHSLLELARLGPDEVRPLIETSLRSLATCP